MERVLIFANHSGGLYDFRGALIRALRQRGTVTVVVPRNDKWDELHQIVDRVIELPLDRRGMDPLRDGRLFRRYRVITKNNG